MQAMSEEVGLRGGWFAGKVMRITDREVLVIYDELLTENGLIYIPYFYAWINGWHSHGWIKHF